MRKSIHVFIAAFAVLVLLCSESVWSSQVIMGLGAEGLSRDNYNEQSAYLHSKAQGFLELSEKLSFEYAAKVKVLTKTQSFKETNTGRNDDENKAEFRIPDAHVSYKTKNFSTSVLVIDQKKTNLFDRLEDRGHLGLYEGITLYKTSDKTERTMNIGLSGYQARLMGFSSGDGNGRLPSLLAESLTISMGRENINIENKLNHFSILNTDGDLAYDSQDYGNSISGVSRENSYFTHGFHGFSNDLEINLKRVVRSSNLKFHFQYLRNNSGEKISNQALTAAVEWQYKKQTYGMENFEIGEQTLPAALFRTYERNVNIKGNKIYASYAFDDYTISAHLAQFQPLNTNPYQEKSNAFFLVFNKSLGDIL
jgi:hypothetical protein